MQRAVALSALAPGERARVTEVCVEGALRRRLYDLGLIPETNVTCRLTAPGGSPTAFLVRGAVIALRASDAAKIFAEALV